MQPNKLVAIVIGCLVNDRFKWALGVKVVTIPAEHPSVAFVGTSPRLWAGVSYWRVLDFDHHTQQ